jgi:hypothetical protein
MNVNMRSCAHCLTELLARETYICTPCAETAAYMRTQRTPTRKVCVVCGCGLFGLETDICAKCAEMCANEPVVAHTPKVCVDCDTRVLCGYKHMGRTLCDDCYDNIPFAQLWAEDDRPTLVPTGNE